MSGFKDRLIPDRDTQNRMSESLRYDSISGDIYLNSVKLVATGNSQQIQFEGKKFKKTRVVYLLLTGRWPEPSLEIDHKDRNTLNDAWENLRPATAKENCANRSKRKTSTRKYLGVSQRNSGKYRVSYRKRDSTKVYLYPFTTAEDAAAARDAAVIKEWGEFAELNFPLKINNTADPEDNVTNRSLLSGRVKRYSTWPTITSQTVGDHTWGVYHIYWRVFGLPTAAIAMYIHLHDIEELITGDLPFPIKSKFPGLREEVNLAELFARQKLDVPDASLWLTDEDKIRVKICDLLEMYQFGMQEREMGNLLATPIVERTRTAALNLAETKLSGPQRDQVIRFVGNENLRHFRVIKTEGSTNVR